MSDSPAPVPPITALNQEHIEFVRQYQTVYNIFRTTTEAESHGSQKEWVRKHVMGKFQQEFGRASVEALLKIDRYLRNHSTCNQKATASINIPDLNPRAVSWVDIAEQDNREAINARALVIREDEGVVTNGDYLRQFRRARNDFVMALPDAKVQEYKELAEVESQRRKGPPTPAVVFGRQPTIPLVINAAIMKYLGWGAGQLGDVVCFVAFAYRTRDLEIKTQFSVVSNTVFSQDEVRIPDITTKFTEVVNPSFKVLANKYLPRLQAEQPQLELNVDNVAPKALREQLTRHIIISWVASGTQSEQRTEDNIPWKDLETPEGRECYLVNQVDFRSFGFPSPTSMTSHDSVHEFTMKLMAPHASPLFKSPMTGTLVFNTLPLPTPNSPEPELELEQSSANFELHNDDHTTILNTDPKESGSFKRMTPPLPQPAITPQLATTPQPSVPSNRPMFTSPLPGRLPAEDPAPGPSVTPPPTIGSATTEAEEHLKQSQHTGSESIDKAVGDTNTARKRKRQPAKRPPVSARELRSSRTEQPNTTAIKRSAPQKKNKTQGK